MGDYSWSKTGLLLSHWIAGATNLWGLMKDHRKEMITSTYKGKGPVGSSHILQRGTKRSRSWPFASTQIYEYKRATRWSGGCQTTLLKFEDQLDAFQESLPKMFRGHDYSNHFSKLFSQPEMNFQDTDGVKISPDSPATMSKGFLRWLLGEPKFLYWNAFLLNDFFERYFEGPTTSASDQLGWYQNSNMKRIVLHELFSWLSMLVKSASHQTPNW